MIDTLNPRGMLEKKKKVCICEMILAEGKSVYSYCEQPHLHGRESKRDGQDGMKVSNGNNLTHFRTVSF